MRTGLTICALVIAATVVFLTWQLDTRERRIVQLEMALAQAHATADSLEAAPDLGAYVGDLCVRVDRLEALAGIGGADE